MIWLIVAAAVALHGVIWWLLRDERRKAQRQREEFYQNRCPDCLEMIWDCRCGTSTE